MTTYFWSDTHFGHSGILGFCKVTRPYRDVVEMDEALIEKWNTRVTKRDRIFVLGDFGFPGGENFGSVPLELIFDRLNGEKHLVVGNHDEKNRRVLLLPWSTTRDIATVKDNGMRAVGCHYPMETWKYPERYVMLHGHSHGTLQRVIPRRFDVGADALGVDGPLTFEEVWAMAAEQTFEPQDHHGNRQ